MFPTTIGPLLIPILCRALGGFSLNFFVVQSAFLHVQGCHAASRAWSWLSNVNSQMQWWRLLQIYRRFHCRMRWPRTSKSGIHWLNQFFRSQAFETVENPWMSEKKAAAVAPSFNLSDLDDHVDDRRRKILWNAPRMKVLFSFQHEQIQVDGDHAEKAGNQWVTQRENKPW